jgi:LmbE family N-acetylglucosaminyl deacetylase
MTHLEKIPVAMVVVAHPDDAEFGCGGSVAKWAREGWHVVLVVCTDASGGGADDALVVGQEARRAITNTRKAEQLASAKILGIRDVVFLDQPDGLLQPTIELRRMLVRLMRISSRAITRIIWLPARLQSRRCIRLRKMLGTFPSC